MPKANSLFVYKQFHCSVCFVLFKSTSVYFFSVLRFTYLQEYENILCLKVGERDLWLCFITKCAQIFTLRLTCFTYRLCVSFRRCILRRLIYVDLPFKKNADSICALAAHMILTLYVMYILKTGEFVKQLIHLIYFQFYINRFWISIFLSNKWYLIQKYLFNILCNVIYWNAR
jgi:hypothetical protein